MLKRSRKATKDLNRLAASIVSAATEPEPPETTPTKNPAAVELGHLGGKKGGPARAARLSPERRTEIARAAAAKRWGSKGRA